LNKIKVGDRKVPEEYAYYKLKGRSAVMVDMLEDLRKARKQATQDLLEEYDAKDAILNYGGFKKGFWIMFYFGQEGRHDFTEAHLKGILPAGWKRSNDAAHGQIFAAPAKDSDDYRKILRKLSFLKHLHDVDTIEKIFGCEQAPMKETPAGKYSGAFVRERLVLDEKKPKEGKLRCPNTHVFGSNGNGKIANPISHLKINGTWYLRMPCNTKGQPHFEPKDADKISLLEMLNIDKIEHQRPQQVCQTPHNPMKP